VYVAYVLTYLSMNGEECERLLLYIGVGGMGNSDRDVNLQNEVLLPQYCVIVLSFMSIKT